ncbi:DUF637 domain-containing protein [Serratia marcescens]|nr:DUF637 domain-containing protein [Serratia marcescens]
MDKPLHPLARAVSHLLIYTTALTPLHPAFAAGITAANGNTQVVIKPGDVPVVNIATPNGAGVSHNSYQDFNVGPQGAVLNNATHGGKTALGVEIYSEQGNTYLKGKPAELIINEVVGGSRSELQGKLEVFGNKANVMIANPNGITCDGCGFINAPGVTLTTGKPQFDKQGALEALEVKKGLITIGGKGLDGSGADYVDIISRATELNGKINAKSLSLTQGANRISFKDGTVTPVAGEGARPQLAVDTKALGGMYANKIRLVATEDGVGVNLKDLSSRDQDITLSANGKIALSGKAHSKTDLNISARELHVTPGAEVQGGRDVTLAAARLTNNGKTTAAGDMRLFGDHIRNAGGDAVLLAGKGMWVQKDATGNVSTEVVNLSGTLKARDGDLVMRTRQLDNARYHASAPPGRIEAGSNAYINADIFRNDQSNLRTGKSLIMTGKRFTHWEDIAAPSGAVGQIRAGGDVVADFTEHLEVLTRTPHRGVHAHDAITGRNLLLKGAQVNNHASLRADNDLTLMSGGGELNVTQSRLLAGNNLALTSLHDIDATQTELRARNIDLLARDGNINLSTPDTGSVTERRGEERHHVVVDSHHYAADGSRLLTSLTASQDISLHGLTISLYDVLVSKVRNFTAHAREQLYISQTATAFDMDTARLKPAGNQTLDDARRALVNRQLARLDRLEASGDMTLYAREGLYLDGQRLSAGGNMTLTGGQDIRLTKRNVNGLDKTLLPPSRYGELAATATAGGHLPLSAGRDILLEGTGLHAGNRLTLLAAHDLRADNLAWSAVDEPGEWRKDTRSRGVELQGDRGLAISTSGALTVVGGRLASGGDITLTSRGDMRFESARTHFKSDTTERYSHTGTVLDSAGNLTLLSTGSILFQASRLLAKGAIDVAAEGGWLYAQAMEESFRWEESSKKCNSFLGIKSCSVFGSKTRVQTKESSTNKVTEFTAGGNINLLARNNVVLEASRIATGKNATITSRTGSVIFRAVRNTAFESVVTNGKGLFITHGNKGYYRQDFMLPSIHTGGALTVDAATGITADVKLKNGQTLQDAIDILSQEPGGRWLKQINQGNNTQWNVVRDAYDSWDYHSQSLNPAVAAVIAIAASAATAGSALAIQAANSFGQGVMSSAVMGGLQALAAQAAVALVENQGNMSKTLRALGSSGTAKAVASTMVIAGALQGFDQQLKLSQAKPGSPLASRLPTLDYKGWSDITTRVAGQSLISSGVNTAIYGGSFREKLTTALLSNVAGQLQAEGAHWLGDRQPILGDAGKALSHAVLAGVTAELARGDARGAVVGALAAELAGVVMQGTLFEPANMNEKERQLSRLQDALNGSEAKEQTVRVIGALTGALFSRTPEGAYSGADSAQTTYRYNMTDHMLMQYALDNQRDVLAAGKGDVAAAKRVTARREAAAVVATVGGGGLVLTAGGLTLIGAAPELVLAARLAIAGCKTNPALCLNQAGIYAADIVAPEAIIGTGALTTGSTLILGKSEDGVKRLSRQLVNVTDELYKTKTFNTQPVADFIKGETAAGANWSTKTADYLRDMQKVSTNQLVKVFDPKQNESKLNVFGQQFEQVLGANGGNKTGTTKVFATEKLSDQEIINYAQSLAGTAALKRVDTPLGIVYYAKKDGLTINLREYSSSKDKTKARWTIDIVGKSSVGDTVGQNIKKVEIKFR